MTAPVQPLCDNEAIQKALELIIDDGQVVELRALEAVTAKDKWPHTVSGYFDDPAKLAQAVASIKSAKGIYFTPNPINPVLLARASNRIRKAPKGESTQDSDIVPRRWFLLDTDPQRPSGISSSDTEHEEAIDRARKIYRYLKECGWPDPISADSGNGAHLSYRIDLPTNDEVLVQRCLESLANRFDDESVKVDLTVFNPARIWKLYGTRACKGDNTIDRPHRMARILSYPDEIAVVPLAKLEQLAAESDSENVDAVVLKQDYKSNGQPFDISDFISRHGLDVSGPEPWNGQQGKGQRWIFNKSPMCDHDDGASHLLEHASGAMSAGCHHNSCSWKWADLRAKFEPPKRINGAKVKAPSTATKHQAPDPFKAFPIKAFPSTVQKIVQIAAKSIGCDPTLIALPMLSAFAGVIGNTRSIQLKPGWEEPSIIWTSVVADSGSMKTPAFKFALKPLEEIQLQALEDHQQTIADYERDKLDYERELKKWKGKGIGDPPEKPEEPQPARFLVSDITVEALASILQANWRGLLLARDEIDGWLNSFDQYRGGKGSDTAAWLSMQAGTSLTVDRKTGNPRTICIPQALVSLSGGIQPGTLKRSLSQKHRENGLAARILFAMPPRSMKQWTDQGIPPEVEARYASIFEKLRELKADIYGDKRPEPVVLRLLPGAKTAWVRFYNTHAKEQVNLSGDLAAVWSKQEAYAARLALVIHCVRWAVDDTTLKTPDAIDVISMEAGITLVRWFGQEARRIYAMLSETEEDEERRRLAEWIDRKGGEITTRELQQGIRQFESSQEAESALNELVKAGYGHWETVATTTKGGRPARRFKLASVSTVYETHAKPEENASSVDVDNNVDQKQSEKPSSTESTSENGQEWGEI